jgi:hypothetical protein
VPWLWSAFAGDTERQHSSLIPGLARLSIHLARLSIHYWQALICKCSSMLVLMGRRDHDMLYC